MGDKWASHEIRGEFREKSRALAIVFMRFLAIVFMRCWSSFFKIYEGIDGTAMKSVKTLGLNG